jgi:gluconate kinase
VSSIFTDFGQGGVSERYSSLISVMLSIRFVIEGRFSLASKRTASRRLFSKPATLLSSQYSISLESPDHDEGVETTYHSQNGCQMPPLDNIFEDVKS